MGQTHPHPAEEIEVESGHNEPTFLTAMRQYKKCLQCDLPHFSTHYILVAYSDIVEYNVSIGNFEEANECLDKVLEIDPGNIEALQVKGTILRLCTISPDIDGVDRAKRFNKTGALYHIRLLLDEAVYQQESNNSTEAIECLDRAINMKKSNPEPPATERLNSPERG
ncbi:hypothetical protein AKO1_006319, partial [Acrasis kona]